MPKSAKEFFQRGRDYYKQGKYLLALKDFKSAIEHDPKLQDAYNDLGNVYSKLGSTQPGAYTHEAIYAYTQAIQLDSKFKYAWYNRSLEYLKLEEYNQALEGFTRAIKLDPNFAFAFINRAKIFIRQYKFLEAIEDFTRALKLQPENGNIRIHRGLTYYDLMRYDDAKSDFYGLEYFTCNEKGIKLQSFYLGDTGLHVAVRNQDKEAALFFLKSGIDQGIRNKENRTPIELACQLGYGEMVKLLTTYRKTKEKLPASLPYYESALTHAVQNKQCSIIKALLDVNTSRDAAVFLVITTDDMKMLDLLLTDFDITLLKIGENSASLLEIARYYHAAECYAFLLIKSLSLQKEVLSEMKKEILETEWPGAFVRFFRREPFPANIDSIFKKFGKELEQGCHAAVFVSIHSLLLSLQPSSDEEKIFLEKFKNKFERIANYLTIVEYFMQEKPAPRPVSIYPSLPQGHVSSFSFLQTVPQATNVYTNTNTNTNTQERPELQTIYVDRRTPRDHYIYNPDKNFDEGLVQEQSTASRLG